MAQNAAYAAQTAKLQNVDRHPATKDSLHSGAMAMGAFLWAMLLTPTPSSAQGDDLIVASITPNKAIHKPLKEIPSLLFGSHETENTDLSAFTKWSNVQKRFQEEAKSPLSKISKDWAKMLDRLRDEDLDTQILNVNSFINETKFVHDSRNWGKGDYWATPAEFFLRGGDCEDYALAKYFSLRELGVAANKMRIAIVHDNKLNVPHALLIVYTAKGPVALDNQNQDIVKASKTSDRYRPIFSLGIDAWWRHS